MGVFHLQSFNVLIPSFRALRAMIADFVFFIGVAAICFSGLLFTLHSLGNNAWFHPPATSLTLSNLF